VNRHPARGRPFGRRRVRGGWRLGTISIDSADAATLASWWADVLDGSVDEFPGVGIHVVRTDRLAGFNLAVQQTADPTPGKNRIHLDFGAPNRTATVDHLIGLDAQRISDRVYEDVRWTVLADADGNQFCVSDAPPG
jgi:hypothetical protein